MGLQMGWGESRVRSVVEQCWKVDLCLKGEGRNVCIWYESGEGASERTLRSG